MYLDDYWNEQAAIATEIALEAHEGQKYGDKDYFEAHVALVAKRVYDDPLASPPQYIAALLHDVLEDSDMQVADLAARSIDIRVIKIVMALTKNEADSDYLVYVSELLGFREAARVKYHDMAQNYSCGKRTKYILPIAMYVAEL